jgi:myo-inositol-hexaphosphate 3-phosphohydrolase
MYTVSKSKKVNIQANTIIPLAIVFTLFVPLLFSPQIAVSAEPSVTVQPKLGPMKGGGNADDPAIWIHPSDPSRSLLFLSDKDAGIYVFNFSGNQLQHINFNTALNNIDVRYGFKFGNETIDIVAGNLRDDGKLAVLRINPNYSGGGYSIRPRRTEQFRK